MKAHYLGRHRPCRAARRALSHDHGDYNHQLLAPKAALHMLQLLEDLLHHCQEGQGT